MKTVRGVCLVFLAVLFSATAGRELRRATVSVSRSVSITGSGSATVSASASATGSAKTTPKKETKKNSVPIPGRTEVYCVVDLTETKTDYIKQLQKNADNLISGLFGISDRIRFGLGTYEDKKSGSSFTHVLSFTKDSTNAISALNGLKAVRASVGLEFQLKALETVAKDEEVANYRDKSKRVVVWIGNAEGKDPADGATEKSVIKALKAKNIQVIAIDTGKLDKSGQASRIVSATDGLVYKVNKAGKFETVALKSTSDDGSSTASASASGDSTFVSTSTDGKEKSATTPVNLLDAILDGVLTLAKPVE